MTIPTMAVACRPDNASSGPAICSLLSGVIESIENHSGTIDMPTHLGLGIRFGLKTSDPHTAGVKIDTTCRIDLATFDLGSSGDDPIHPTPAVHLDAKLWKQGLNGSQRHLYGCLLYTSPSPRDRQKSRMPSSA